MATTPRAPRSRPQDEPEPTWQPISQLPLIASVIDGMLADDETTYATLLEARPKPHVLDDATIARTTRVFAEQQDDLGLYEEQLARWKRLDLAAGQRREVERLTGQLGRVRAVVAAILALTDELEGGTIERVLAKSDLELGLEVLAGRRPPGGPRGAAPRPGPSDPSARGGRRGARSPGPARATPTGFRLPPDVTVERQTLPDGAAYQFRHARLGRLGRLVLTDLGPGQMQLTAEVVGHPDDPTTQERRVLLGPLVDQLTELLTHRAGAPHPGPDVPPPAPVAAPAPAGTRSGGAGGGDYVVASKLLQCERCEAPVALLIFADDPATGTLEDHARLMYEQIVGLGLPAWVIGPPLGTPPPGGGDDRRPAEILQVYPEREPVVRLPPAAFNPVLDALCQEHCPPR